MTTLTTQDNDTSAGTLADLAGRVLSKKSRQIVEDALAALKNLISYADKTGEEMPDEDEMPMDMTAELSSGGYVVELGLTQGKPFAGFALGKFVDMHGRAVEFAKDSISEFLSNTIKAIDAAKAKRMPGLPIDAQKHDKGEAAGWIVSAELGEVTDSGGDSIPAIYLAAEWTSLGVRLLSDKILTNFSPTVDLTNKTIRGGSLTNWPASVDAKGVPLFNAVELQAQSQTSDNPVVAAESQTDISDNEDKDMTIEMTQELEEMVSARVKAALAEQNAGSQKVDLAQLVEAFGLNTEDAQQNQIKHLDELAQMVERQANLKWQQKLSTMQRENRTAELAQRVTGGTPDAPRGIPTQSEVLKAELMKLSNEQAKFWGGLMETITQNGLVDFSELGHSKKLTGTHQLPAEYATALTEGKLTVADLSNPIIANDLGDLNQYDLSQWGKK